MTSTVDNSTESLIYFAYPELCKGLKNVSDSCFRPNLNACYDPQDASFHFAYMLEELKRAGIMISLHLFPSTEHGQTFNVLQCPVFKETSPFSSTNNDKFILIFLSIVLSLVLCGFAVGLAIFAIKKFRLMPRFRAFLQKEPYEDIVIATMETNIDHPGSPANVQDQEQIRVEVLPNPSQLNVKSNRTSVSMANLDHREESVQST